MYTSQWTLKQLKSMLDDEAKAVGAADAESGEKGKEESGTKVVVLINENSPVLSPLLFLRKKGYKIKITHKLSEAVSEVSKQRPDIFLISWNLKRVDVRKVYQLLTKNFKLLCVIFGEENNPKTSSGMMRSGIPNSIFPPISGPGVHMRIQALLRGKAERKQVAKNKMQMSFEAGETKKKKEGYSFSRDEVQIIKSSPELVEQTRSPLFRVMSNLKEVPKNAKWSEIQQINNETKLFEGVSKQDNKDSFYYFKGSAKPVLNEAGDGWIVPEKKLPVVVTERKADEQLLEGVKTGAFDSYLQDSDEEDQVYHFKGEAKKDDTGLQIFKKEDNSKMYEAVQEGVKGTEYEFTDPGIAQSPNLSEAELRAALEKAMLNTDEPVIEESSDGLLDEFSAIQSGTKPADLNYLDKNPKLDDSKTPTFESSPTQQQQKSGYNVFSNAQIEFKAADPTSILAKCVKAAVENIAQSDKSEIQEIQNLSRVTLTVIKSAAFKGYLVGGNATDVADRNLMKKVLDHLNEKMNSAGHPLEAVTGILELQFDPLPFMLWAESKAEFFVKSNYGDEQVVFAYIPTEELPQVIQTETDHLLAVKLENVIHDSQILFDAYIHMPKNNKFLLYLKKGATFTANTISKLSKFAVNQIYIKKSEENLYYTYCAKHKFLQSAAEVLNKKAS